MFVLPDESESGRSFFGRVSQALGMLGMGKPIGKIEADDQSEYGHADARDFYKSVISRIQEARDRGDREMRVEASEKPGFASMLLPRMGFDAKIPDEVRGELPESLSHAESLLDLHATPEGTRWWAENGFDIDVSILLEDRSSPQSKIVDRFIRHFSTERRDIPLGAGDGWLSPGDLMRLDEMWQEVMDEGDLDDYQWRDSDGNP